MSVSASPPSSSLPFDEAGRAAVAAALDAAIPGSVDLGALDYVEGLLTALDHDPPHIWAAPAGSGAHWLELGPWERQAWGQRIDAWRAVYGRVASGTASAADLRVVHGHAAEGTYGDPAYGGNVGGQGWQQIGFPEPLFPPARPTDAAPNFLWKHGGESNNHRRFGGDAGGDE